MKEKDLGRPVETIETTIGELVETITQIAQELGKSEQESYQLASAAIESILRRSHSGYELIN
jgi:hypothetical protein